MVVKGISDDAFWKGEIRVRGVVEEDGTEFSAVLYLKDGQAYDYSCTCAIGSRGSRMCPHCEALQEAYGKKEKQNNKGYVSTTPSVRVMVREYTNREVARIMGDDEMEKIRLAPRLKISRQGVFLSCSIGRDRLYQIRDLSAFARAMETGEYAEYGKKLAFAHSIHAFTSESAPLVHLLTGLAGSLKDCYEQMRKGSPAVAPSFQSLKLGRTACDRFFDAVEGRTVEAEDGGGRVLSLLAVRSNPPFHVLVKAEGEGGIQVSVPEGVLVFHGQVSLYVAYQGCLYCCDEEYSERLGIFLVQMLNEPGACGTVRVNSRDIPLFYERVLKTIESMGILQTAGVDLEKYRPQELKARFEFDVRGPGNVVLRPVLSYGDYLFHPLEDENLPHGICRDVPGEFRISRTITRYFECREDETKDLVIREDEDAVFRLLDEGLDRFRTVGEVILSDRFQEMKVRDVPRVSLGVSMTGGWLELSVDAGELNGADLTEVLAQYAKKKKYYRMRNREFLRLEDSGLFAVSNLTSLLGIGKNQLQSGSFRLEQYRALYLDAVLKEDAGVDFYRDTGFRSLVRSMKSVEDSRFELPGELKGALREYQKVGFCWLRSLDEYHFGGILADDMGLGKTIQIISLLLDWAGARNGSSPRASLVVCPASLIFNWGQELETFAPSLKAVMVNGTLADRKKALEQTDDFDVVITSYDLLRRDLNIYKEKMFRYEIIDEAQYIKNAGTQNARAVKAVKAMTRFALTGTPVENRLSELWSIFDYLMPGFLFGYRRFKTVFEQPIVRDQDPKALDNLRRLIGPFVLRRLKSDVLKELPEKLEEVVYSALEGKQEELYLANAIKLKERLEQGAIEADGAGRFEILSALMRLRQICCDPSLCYEGYDKGSAKLETCLSLVSSAAASGHKVLLFSQFSSMLAIIGKRLDKEGIPYHMLTGSTPKEERNQMVTAFHKDDTRVFLISLKAGGTGLNLTAADIVIHYDPWWNVAAQNQATDRAHRIGQKKQVTVLKLIMKNTIEENILKLQESKQQLADQVVTEGMVSLGSLNREELLEILG